MDLLYPLARDIIRGGCGVMFKPGGVKILRVDERVGRGVYKSVKAASYMRIGRRCDVVELKPLESRSTIDQDVKVERDMQRKFHGRMQEIIDGLETLIGKHSD